MSCPSPVGTAELISESSDAALGTNGWTVNLGLLDTQSLETLSVSVKPSKSLEWGERDKSSPICSSPPETRPLLLLPDPGSGTHTLVTGGSGLWQTSPLLEEVEGSL